MAKCSDTIKPGNRNHQNKHRESRDTLFAQTIQKDVVCSLPVHVRTECAISIRAKLRKRRAKHAKTGSFYPEPWHQPKHNVLPQHEAAASGRVVANVVQSRPNRLSVSVTVKEQRPEAHAYQR